MPRVVSEFPSNEARSNLLGRLACIAFVFGSTISLSFAGFQDGGVRGSRGSFVGPVRRIGFTASHGSVAAHNPYLSGYRVEAMGYPENKFASHPRISDDRR